MITIVLWVIILLSVLYVLRFVWTAFSAPEVDNSAVEPAMPKQTQQTLAESKAIYRERLQQIEQQLATGDLTESTFQNLKTELDRQLLLDSESALPTRQASASVHPSAGLWPVSIAVAAVLLASVAYYYSQWQVESQQWLQVKSSTKDWVAEGIANDYLPPTSAMADKDVYQSYLRGLHALVLAEGQKNPDTVKLLANSYAEVGIFDMAEPLYKQLLSLPDQETDEQSLAYVNAMMMANDGKMSQESARRLEKLFRREGGPTPEVLYLLGLGAFNSGNYEIAITSWQPVLAVYPQDSPAYQELLGKMNQAKAALASAAGSPGASAPSAQALSLPVTLVLSDELGAQVAEAIAQAAQPLHLVLYARSPDMPMPVAVRRQVITSATQWPMSLSLSDQDSLMPERLLRDQASVILGARIARTDDMRAQSGDFQSDEIELSIAASRLAKPTVLTLATVID